MKPATSDPTAALPHRTAPWSRAVGGLIFFSRWLQAPLYLGLIIAQAIYVVEFFKELWHLVEGVFFSGGHALSETDIMLLVLGLIDVVMIANLLIMVIIGGYETFVSRIGVDGHPDEPEWLSHVNANVLKVKLAMAIVGISSIHLLKTFISVGGLPADGSVASDGEKYTATGVLWQVVIHLVFIVSALALALIDRMSYQKAGAHEVRITHDGGAVPAGTPVPASNAADTAIAETAGPAPAPAVAPAESAAPAKH